MMRQIFFPRSGGFPFIVVGQGGGPVFVSYALPRCLVASSSLLISL